VFLRKKLVVDDFKANISSVGFDSIDISSGKKAP
jgi:hypothetical protein